MRKLIKYLIITILFPVWLLLATIVTIIWAFEDENKTWLSLWIDLIWTNNQE
jgi:hypothetical protein